MEALRPLPPLADGDTVLVGKSKLLATVVKAVREGDKAVIVRWESTKKEEEISRIGLDVERVDLDAKRRTRGKRSEASGSEVATPPRKRTKADEPAKGVAESSAAAEARALAAGDPAAIRRAYANEQGQADESSSAEEDAGAEDPPSEPEGIDRHVKALQSGDAEGKAKAAEGLVQFIREAYKNRAVVTAAGAIKPLVALLTMDPPHGDAECYAAEALELLACDDANCAAIAEAGAIKRLVVLATVDSMDRVHIASSQAKGALWFLAAPYGSLDSNRVAIATEIVALLVNGSARCQEKAVGVVKHLLLDSFGTNVGEGPTHANKVALAEAGAIPPLVEIVKNHGAAKVQAEAAQVLARLAYSETSTNRLAIIAAGGVEALTPLLGRERGKKDAEYALRNLHPAECVSELQSKKASLKSENESLKHQLAGDDVVDLREGDASPPAKKRNALRDAHDEQQAATLNHVKQENVVVEGQRDRTDATAAEASAAAAKASAAAAKASAAAVTAKDDAEEAQDTLGYQVRFTDALQTKIDELHALACQVDPVAADAIKNRAIQ